MNDVETRTLHTDDGLALVAELAPPTRATGPAHAAVVLCHPHPQYGGSMRSIVISVLFDELPAHGFACLRFNFRGVEGSAGAYSDGRDEPLDIGAAIEAITEAAPAAPIVLVGWSFGADMALVVRDARLRGWIAIAPPLRFRSSFTDAAGDNRPKHLVLAEHDEYRAPGDVQRETAEWVNTTNAVVSGASHFFVGRTDRVVIETRAGIERVLG